MALTGSPLQNNLVEYYTMVDFVRKGMLGTLERFKNYFETPIINGMLKDSSAYDVKVGQLSVSLRSSCCNVVDLVVVLLSSTRLLRRFPFRVRGRAVN